MGIKFYKADCYDVMTLCKGKCLHSYCNNKGSKFDIELHVDWSTPTPNAPPKIIFPY